MATSESASPNGTSPVSSEAALGTSATSASSLASYSTSHERPGSQCGVHGWENFPYSLRNYIPGLDYGRHFRDQALAAAQTWRNEAYTSSSKVDVYELLPTKARNHIGLDDTAVEQLLNDNVFLSRYIILDNYQCSAGHDGSAKPGDGLAQSSVGGGGIIETLNISQALMSKLLTAIDVPTFAIGHIRGQASSFGSRMIDSGPNKCYDFWYLLMGQSYVPAEESLVELNITLLTHYDIQSGQTTVLVKYRPYGIETVCEEIKTQLRESFTIEDKPSLAENPFALHLVFLYAVVQFWWSALRGPRAYVSQQESNAHVKISEIDVAKLHMCIRRLELYKADLEFFEDLLQALRREHTRFISQIWARKNNREPHFKDRVEDQLLWHSHQVRHIKRTTITLGDRAKHLLELYFNMIMENNSKSTAKVAGLARHDSISMVSIAVVTMLFLPTTFVSTILGCNIFQSTPTAGFRATQSWWILPATSFPLTGLTFVAWYIWRKVETNRTQARKVGDEEAVIRSKARGGWGQTALWYSNEIKEHKPLNLMGMSSGKSE